MSVNLKEFKPVSVQNYDALHPGFKHRLVDKNPQNRRGDRLAYWMNQGWEIAPYGNEGMKGNRDTGTTSKDGAVHYRGLVLVRAPVELANARNEHYRGKHKRLLDANTAMRELSKASGGVNSQVRRKLTSAFAEAHAEQNGRVLEDSRADSRDPEKILRDIDPAAIREVQERIAQMEENHRKLQEENSRLRQEMEERGKRPSDRRRKNFPVS